MSIHILYLFKNNPSNLFYYCYVQRRSQNFKRKGGGGLNFPVQSNRILIAVVKRKK